MTDHKSHAKRRSRAASKTQPSEPVEAEEETRPDVHLVLLLHGLYGSPSNLWCLEEEIRAPCQSRKPEGGDEDGASAVPATPSSDDGHLETVVLNARSYIGAQTWDGIDVNAQRVAKEVS
jgi:hypothetical protein